MVSYIIRRSMSTALIVVFVITTVISGTLAWVSIGQNALNILEYTSEGYEVVLIKLDKDTDGPLREFWFELFDSDDNSLGQFETDQFGKIKIRLEPGDYYWEEILPIWPYTFDGTERTDFTVTGTETEPIEIIVYNVLIEGSLIIEKTVENEDESELTEDQLELEFSFIVTFSDDGSYDYQINGIGTVYTLDSGDTIKLKHGEHAVFMSIPAGVEYVIEEIATADYELVVYDNDEGTITDDEPRLATFVNMYIDPNGDIEEPEDVSLIITKLVEGNVPAEDEDLEFEFEVTIDGETQTVKLKAGQSETITDIPAEASVTVSEVNLKSGYALIDKQTDNLSDGTITVTFTNKYMLPIMIIIEGKKTWDKNGHAVDLPENITVYLKDGTTTVATTTTNAQEGWEYEFTVPKYRSDGVTEIQYTVEEKAIESWNAEVDEDNNIKNTYMLPVKADPPIAKKVITGSPGTSSKFQFMMTGLDGAPMPSGSKDGVKTITITGEGEKDFGEITYIKAGTYVYTISEINTGEDGYTYDESLYTLTFVVEEHDNVLVVESIILTKNGQAAEQAVFENSYSPDHINIRVTKVWQDGNASTRPQSVKAQLYKNGAVHGEAVTLNENNGWTYMWTELDKGPVWTVDEINVPNGYTKSISGDALNGFIITNNKDGGETTAINITKVWIDGESPNRPASVTVQLYRGGQSHGSPVTLNEGNGWKYTWTNLDKDATWTVDETVVPAGYFKTISGNGETGYTITNTKGSAPPAGKVNVSGFKTWDHGQLPEQYHSKAITILVMDGDRIVVQRQITAGDNWSWSFHLDKYDEDGREIIYTVDEINVAGYIKQVNGYNVKNTFDPNDPNRPDKVDTDKKPQTGHESNILIWLTLMVLSLEGMAIALIINRKANRYVPKYLKQP